VKDSLLSHCLGEWTHLSKGLKRLRQDSDFVKMGDIKSVLKLGGVKEKDVLTIQKMVEEMFEGVEFKYDTTINCERVRRVFVGLKSKHS